MRENFSYEPLENLAGYAVEDETDTIEQTLYNGYRRLSVSPGTGKIGVLLFPQFLPTNDLIYNRKQDNYETNYVDESVQMVTESWPKSSRPPLINFGGNRVGIVNQRMMFDAGESQLNEDVLPVSFKWYIDDKYVAEKSVFYKTFTKAGLYKITCEIAGEKSSRYVRILNQWGESDLDIIKISSLNGSVETGWQISLDVKNNIKELNPYQGIMLYVYDTQDQSWRRQYNNNMRAINRRMKNTSDLPPDPLWQTTYVGWSEGEASYYVYTEEPKNPLLLQEKCWPNVDYHLDTYIQSQSKYGAPANLGRALACELTNGNKTYPFGSDRAKLTGSEHVRLGMLKLAEYYRDCGNSWKKAIKAFVNGTCPSDDKILWNSKEARVFDNWNFLDNVGGIGSSILAKSSKRAIDLERVLTIPSQGNVLFFGYIDECSIEETANETTMTLSIINTAEMLNKVYQRMETYWESGVHATSGGTVMEGPPMRSATCIHHLLTYHTNFTKYHDVILDWFGPRFWATTSPEGTTWQAISGWANNDYAWAFADRYGQVRYMTRPQYRGSQWYAEAIKEAIRIDEEHVIEMQVTELRMLKRTSYTRLCGNVRGGNCEICGEFPCGGPSEKSPGQWTIKRGLQYDDYRVLCRFAAYDYAYENRSYDIQVAMPWRHDLDLGDLIFFPYNDPQKRFLWNIAAPPVFVIKQISHQYDVPSARWITTIAAEQLTYGVACDCDNQTCPTTQDDGICDGDIGCDLIMDPEKWQIEQTIESKGQKITVENETRNGYLTTYNPNGTTLTTEIYGAGKRTLRSDNILEKRETKKGTVGLIEPSMYLTDTVYESNIGNAISQEVDITVPSFTISAKGPVGGSLKIEMRLRAKKRRRAYIHMFYIDPNAPVTSETDDYIDGQSVYLKNGNVDLFDESNPETATVITGLKINTLLTIVGSFVETNTRKLYPVVVNQKGDYQNGDKAMVRLPNTKVRTSHGYGFGYTTTLTEKDVVIITGNYVEADETVWYPIKKGTVTGWLNKEDLRNLSGWADAIHFIKNRAVGDGTPVEQAQLKIPKELQQTFLSFPLFSFDETVDITESFADDGTGTGTKNTIVKIATIEQYDLKLRDITETDFFDTLSFSISLPTKEAAVDYKIGFMVTSEYDGESWAYVDAYPAQELESWLNETTIDYQYNVCECSMLLLEDLPISVQQAVNSLGPISITKWQEIRDTLCVIYPPLKCPGSVRVDKKVYENVITGLENINRYNGEDLVYIEKTIKKVGASASLEVLPACKDCFDPMAASQNSNWNVFGTGYGSKPSVFLLAGHASYNDAGNPTERDYNIRLTQAYKEAFSAAGYSVIWWQEADGDANPTMSPGNHSTVAQGVAALMANTGGELILLDLHHEMIQGAPGVFAIIPDAGPDDTWELNNNAINLGKVIVQNIKLATGMQLRTSGVKEDGLMSEKQTGAGEDGGRLGTFFYTKSLRNSAVRLIIEHGNMLTGDMDLIRSADFPKKCAEAAVKAVDQVYPSSAFLTGCDNWPTAAAINTELQKRRNGRISPMAPFAAKFIEWGGQYGINPAFVLALCFSESQFGTDGDLAFNANNYGGHGYNAEISTCRAYRMAGRDWSCYTTPEQGCEALFKFLDRPIYRQSNGTIKGIIDIYSPNSDNASAVITEKYEIIKEIGRLLGVTLEKTTPIYTDVSMCVDGGTVPPPGANYGGYTTMFEWQFLQSQAYITQGPYGSYSHSQCDCYDFGVVLNTPIYPILEGTVIFAQLVYDQNRPYQVKIQTAYGVIVYSHLNVCYVRTGQKVYLNTMIGRSGTCCDTIQGGPHLHIGLQGGKAGSTGGKYTFTDIFRLAGINLARFGRSY